MSTSSFIQGARLNLIANVLQKLVTFSLNQLLLRWTTPDVIGQASIQLELLLSTMLFLSREGIRLACLRERISDEKDRQTLVNISWIPFAILFTTGSIVVLINGSSIGLVMILYWAGACFESLAEPWFNLFQNALLFGAKVKSEMIAVFVRCIIAFVCVGCLQMHLTGFGVAQFAYGLTYCLVIVSHMKIYNISTDGRANLSVTDFLPRLLKKSNKDLYFDCFLKSTCHVAASSLVSSIVKHCLTEADKIVLTLSTNNYNQGIYAITNNYGSLVARMIFLPLEDASKLIFSKHVSILRTAYSSTELSATDQIKQCQESITAMKSLLIQLLRLVCIVAIFFPVFGYAYSEVAVNLLFSSQWRSTETISTLSYYCFYIFFMAINGISEAFVQSTFPASSYATLSFGLLMSTAVFVGVALPGIKYLGTSGIVLANAASYATRIGFNLIIIHRAFNRVEQFVDGTVSQPVKSKSFLVTLKNVVKSPIPELVPTFYSVICVVSYFIIANMLSYRYKTTSMTMKDTLFHIILGGISAVSMLLVIIFRLCPKEDLLHFRKLIDKKSKVE